MTEGGGSYESEYLGDCKARGGAFLCDRLAVFVDMPLDLDFEFTLNPTTLAGICDFHRGAESSRKIHGHCAFPSAECYVARSSRRLRLHMSGLILKT